MSADHGFAEVGPWAQEKLDALERYLDYYTKVLKRQPWRTIYFDAFAGGGQAAIRRRPSSDDLIASLWTQEPAEERLELINGSPLRALNIDNPFDRYVFVDADPARVGQLDALREEFNGRRVISVRQGTAADEVDWLLSRNISRATHRGVAFLDPFGAHLEWRSIQALADTRVFEVIINFPLHMAINRLMKVDAQIPATWRAQLDGFFGTDWYEQVYSVSDGLFGPITEKRSDALDRLLTFYRQKLKRAFGHVSQPKLIRNTKGHPLYYLLWAGPHAKGLKGADYVLQMGEKIAPAP